MMRLFSILVLSLFISQFFTACSEDAVKHDEFADWSALDFYDEATASLKAGEFETAIKHLENLEARFPFSPYARQAQLDVAYAYYKFDEPESAIAAADRFIRINPRDRNIDYAWYLKGLADYNRGKGILDGLFPRDIAQHDNKSMHNALQSFSTLVKRFPDSRYAMDAYQHMVYLRNKLAESEIHAANYYIKRKAWLAAAKRGQYVLETYPTTPASRKALEIMVQAYTALKLDDLAADTQLVLNTNKEDKQGQQIASANMQQKAAELKAPVN